MLPTTRGKALKFALSTLFAVPFFSSAVTAEPSSVSAFGLHLESGIDENTLDYKIPFLWTKTSTRECESDALVVHHYGTDKKLRDFRFAKGGVADRFERNIYEVDYSDRVSGGWYQAPGSLVCFVYFDDKLMNVFTYGRSKDEHQKLIDALRAKYPNDVVGSGILLFDTPPGTVIVASGRGITISHEALRAEFLHWAIELHQEAEEKSRASSPF